MQIISQDFEERLIKELSKKVDEVVNRIEETYVVKSEYLSLKKAAVYADTSYPTIQKWLKMGLPITIIDGVQRIKRSDLDDFMNTFKIGDTI